jgi:transposase
MLAGLEASIDGRPYSLDLRERVVAAVLAGESCRAVAASFRVSVSAVVKWSQRFRKTGSAAAGRIGGYRPRTLEAESDWLLARLAEQPDLTLRALVVELGERGVVTSYGSVWRTVHRANFSFKKNAVRHRAGSSRRRPKAGSLESLSGPA